MAHNHQVVGSNPTPATKFIEKLLRKFFCYTRHMYYGGGQEEVYSYAMLTYGLAFVAVPLFMLAAVATFFVARKRKSHKKLLFGISIFALVVSLIFGYVIVQGKPRCCGEGITYQVVSQILS